MKAPSRRSTLIAFSGLLLIVDWFLYFRHAGHFFQADTIFLLNHRAGSLRDYWKEFVQLNPSGWFRPLTNELIESIFYPLAGLHPVPYRIPVYFVFIGITVLVYALSLAVTRRHLAAAVASFFFTVHTTNAYTTFDLGFMPELLYGCFYVGATLAFVRYLEDGNKWAYRLSIAGFVGSLLSKEAALTLPAALILAGLTVSNSSRPYRERFVHVLRSTMPHVVILIVYLAYAVGHLGVMGLSIPKMFDQSQKPNPGDYIAVLNGGVFTNADLALSWAFNFPRGWWGQWSQLKPGMVSYLRLFRALALALTAAALLRSDRKVVLFGAGWFFITLLPALPLVSHFLPYYLFLPIIGLSIVTGVAFAWLYDLIGRFQPLLAGALIVAIFSGVLYVTSRGVRSNIQDNPLLGASSRLASGTLNDLKRFYPELPADATLYFADTSDSLAWHHDAGGLVKMAYGTDRISSLYQSQGDSLVPDTANVFYFDVQHGRLVNQTVSYRSNPMNFMKFVESDVELRLSADDVAVGDKYELTVSRLSATPVRIAYTVNGGALEVFTAYLDADGEATFTVSKETRKGIYRFCAFSLPSKEWVRTERKLRVR